MKATRKIKTRVIRSFKGLDIANDVDAFKDLGSKHAEVKIIEIDNPHYSKTHAGASGNPKTVTAALNLRESPVAMMAAKGHLEPHQVEAAIKFRRIWEALGAGAGSFDYSREPVDGGGAREPITDRQVDAGKQLKQISDLLGPRPYSVVSKVAGEGRTIAELGASKRARHTLADYLKDALEDLAVYWGFQKRKTPQISSPVVLSR